MTAETTTEHYGLDLHLYSRVSSSSHAVIHGNHNHQTWGPLVFSLVIIQCETERTTHVRQYLNKTVDDGKQCGRLTKRHIAERHSCGLRVPSRQKVRPIKNVESIKNPTLDDDAECHVYALRFIYLVWEHFKCVWVSFATNNAGKVKGVFTFSHSLSLLSGCICEQHPLGEWFCVAPKRVALLILLFLFCLKRTMGVVDVHLWHVGFCLVCQKGKHVLDTRDACDLVVYDMCEIDSTWHFSWEPKLNKHC